MPKQKTRKTLAKRLKITKSGLVFRGHQMARHRRSHKSKRRIRSFRRPVKMPSKQAKRMIKALGRKS